MGTVFYFFQFCDIEILTFFSELVKLIEFISEKLHLSKIFPFFWAQKRNKIFQKNK